MKDEVDNARRLLQRLEALLGGANYSVGSLVTFVHQGNAEPIIDSIKRSMPFEADVEIGATQTWLIVERELRQCLFHSGDYAYGPRAEILTSIPFQSTVSDLLAILRGWCEQGAQVWSIGIVGRNGSRWYPVYWEYSWVFRLRNIVIIVAGFASD